MSSLSSLSRAVSGLMSNQTALNTTAHNLTNVDTPGYVRQQVLFNDSSYQTIGSSATSLNQIGLGTDITEIRQVRDQFLDIAYRDESGRYGFYSAQSTTVEEIENILGETEGEAFSGILNDLWVSLNELSKHPDGLETRGAFIQNSVLFVEKANLIMDQMTEYQVNMNDEIIEKVERINEIGEQIFELNGIIAQEEAAGGNANDYRDVRNTLVDELSGLVDISTKEDTFGNLLVSVENVPFVTVGESWEMSTVQADDFSSMIDPYWPHLSSAGPPEIIKKVFNFDNPIGAQYDNDKGELKGMLISRGTRTANYTDLQSPTYEDEIEQSEIMTAQAQFDMLVHSVVTSINDILSPLAGGTTDPTDPGYIGTMANDAPYGMSDDSYQGIELFTRSHMDRYDGTGNYNVETNNVDRTDPSFDEYSLYSAGNIEINPEILVDYNKLTISGDFGLDGDGSVVEDIIAKWQDEYLTLEPGTSTEYDFNGFYNAFVANVGNRGSAINNQMENQEVLTNQIDNQRSSLMGVSSDEELSNMMIYQHAYNASARVVSVVDEMIGRVIDQTGVVGR